MDTHGVFIRSLGRTSLIVRATGWQAASLVAIVVFRGHHAQIHLPVRHRPHPVACLPMVHWSGVKVHHAKAHRRVLGPLSGGWLKRPPLHSRLFQTKRIVARMQSALRHGGQRHLRLIVIPRAPLIPIYLRRRVMGDGPESGKILTPLQTHTPRHPVHDPSQGSTLRLECEQRQEARVAVAQMIRVISGCACQLLWRRGIVRVASKKTNQHQRP